MTLSTNRTEEFREAIAARRTCKPSSTEKNVPSSTTDSGGKRRPHGPTSSDVWTKEAQLVANNIEDLLNFLSSIRRAYLDPSPSGSTSLLPSNNNTDRTVDAQKGFKGFANVRWFSEKEKDEVDVLVGVGLRKSVEGVRALEAAERSRKAQQTGRQTNALSRFLRLSLDMEDAAAEQFNSHRASILWYLNQRLTELGKVIKDQQEGRAKKKMEKAMKSGLSGMMNVPGSSLRTGTSQATMLSSSSQTSVPAIYRPPLDDPLQESGDEKPIESILTPTQIQQFESESSALLEATENTLASIKQTESSLMEISNLQTELVHHLTQQTEMIDQLWDDAVVSAGKIEQGNAQLIKAKENNKESRIYLLVFLLGSSLALLFLDYVAP